jgi:hypothetical protein
MQNKSDLFLIKSGSRSLFFNFKNMLISVIEQLKLVKDFRKNRGKRHELWVVLAIILLAILTGNVTYQDMAIFRKRQKNKLIELLQITQNVLPSYSTIRRILRE